MFDFPVGDNGPGMNAYRSTSLFQPHRTRQAIRDAHAKKIQPLMGIYLAVSSIPVARLVAPLGFDTVWIDWEHSSCNVETMTTMVHEIMFMSEGRTIPFVRIPGHDHASIGYALDAGASIIAPQVDTVEQARHIISAAKFGSKNKGTRSAPPFRLIPNLTDLPHDIEKSLHENLNDQAAIMIQVETIEGINNLDAILTACPEIDAVWLGTLDCRISMNLPANFGAGNEPEWVQAQAKYIETMKKHDKPKAGFALGPPQAVTAMGEGKSFLIVAADAVAIIGLTRDLATARDLFPARGAKDQYGEL